MRSLYHQLSLICLLLIAFQDQVFSQIQLAQYASNAISATGRPLAEALQTTATCSISAVAVAGTCAATTNMYSATATITVNNPTEGILTITDGVQSQVFATTSGGSAVFTVIFHDLNSDGVNHSVVASLPGCATTSANYQAPASCSTDPIHSLTATASISSCDPATNTYSNTVVIGITNPVTDILTVTDGVKSLTMATTPAKSATYTAVFTGLLSDGGPHIVTASLPTCSSTTVGYTAPVSCSVVCVQPVASATAVSPTCSATSNVANSNGQLLISASNADKIAFSVGGSFSGTYASAQSYAALPTRGSGKVLVSTLSNPGTPQPYTIRFYGTDSTCFTDVVVQLQPITCTCPPSACVPIAVNRIH
ncbi:hypothetical protein WBJ53_06980 [Spirosoma sp. SC4-14]|uniref:hypothetical protein n=1 Tax=Spirosoma sp. SC4-14 TaxID=3128900 RepID=UPI0030D5644C